MTTVYIAPQIRGDRVRVIKQDLPTDLSQIELHVFADDHQGDAHCDLDLVKKRIEYVKDTPNAYALLNGDIMNNATKTSVSDTYTGMTPMEELRQAIDIYRPIADKILAIDPGNHERRTYRTEGIHLTEIMARELGIYDVYSEGTTVLFLRFGDDAKHRKILYTIYMTHGSGGGRTAGGKIKKLMDLEAIIDTDIYIHSHTHLPALARLGFFRTSHVTSSVYMVDKLFVNTAASLNYGGYGETQGYAPSSKAAPVIYLNGNYKYAKAMV